MPPSRPLPPPGRLETEQLNEMPSTPHSYLIGIFFSGKGRGRRAHGKVLAPRTAQLRDEREASRRGVETISIIDKDEGQVGRMADGVGATPDARNADPLVVDATPPTDVALVQHERMNHLKAVENEKNRRPALSEWLVDASPPSLSTPTTVRRRTHQSVHVSDDETRLRDRRQTIGVKLEAIERVMIQESHFCGCFRVGCGELSAHGRMFEASFASAIARWHAWWRETAHYVRMTYPCALRWGFTVPVGLLSLCVFYLDLIADSMVAYQFYSVAEELWFAESVCFISAQYFAVHLIVLRYAARGHTDRRVLSMCIWYIGLIGFPLLPFLLDLLMFLEPLTLLSTLHSCLPAPLAEELITFLPRYRRMRVVIELLLEGIPQSILELYIYIRVHVYIGRGYCGDIERSRLGYTIGRTVLERSMTLTAIGIAKVAFEYYLESGDDDDNAEEIAQLPAASRARMFLWKLINLGYTGPDEANTLQDEGASESRGEQQPSRRTSGVGPPNTSSESAPGSSLAGRIDGAHAPGTAYGICAQRQRAISLPPPPRHLERIPSRGALIDAGTAEMVITNASGILV